MSKNTPIRFICLPVDKCYLEKFWRGAYYSIWDLDYVIPRRDEDRGGPFWVYSAVRSRGSSVTDCLSHFYLEGERVKAKVTSLIKKQLSLLLISREAVIFVVAKYPLFCLVLDIIMK